MIKELKDICDIIVDMSELHKLFEKDFADMDLLLQAMKAKLKEREKGLLLPGDTFVMQFKTTGVTDPMFKWVLIKKAKKGFALDDGEGNIIHQQKAYYYQDQIIEL